MNLYAFRSEARVYFADKATDKAAIPEECATPSLLLFNPSTCQARPRFSDLAWETVFNARFTAGECKRNNLLSLAMSAEERLGRVTK
jgi:hypothetical protein